MRKLIIAGTFLTLMTTSQLALAARGHAHGVGALDIVVSDTQLSLALELPLDAAAGFERAPKTAAEKAVLEEASKVLNNGAAVFIPTPAAACTLHSTEVRIPFTASDAAQKETGEHADIHAAYVFDCTAPKALKGFETSLFKQFRRLYRIEARRVGPDNQGTGKLTPKSPALSW